MKIKSFLFYLIICILSGCTTLEVTHELSDADIVARDLSVALNRAKLIQQNPESRPMPYTVVLIANPFSDTVQLGGGVGYEDRSGVLSFTADVVDARNRKRTIQIHGGRAGGGLLTVSPYLRTDVFETAYMIDANGRLERILPELESDPCAGLLGRGGDLTAYLECLNAGGESPSGGGGGLSPPQGFGPATEPDCADGRMTSPPVAPSGSRQRYQQVARANAASDPGLKRRLSALDEAQRNLEYVQDYNADTLTWYLNRGEDIPDDLAEEIDRSLAEAQAAVDTAQRKLEDYMDESGEYDSQLEPIPGEESGIRDPRCQQRETDSASGLLFRNPDFCPSHDYLACLADEQDPVRRITGGKCVTGPSPVGGTTLICGGPNGSEIFAPPEPSEGNDQGCNDREAPCWTDPNSPPVYRGQLQTSYIDLLDLGPVFLGLCAVDRCPGGDPRIPDARPR